MVNSPNQELAGCTPLQAASTPNLDFLARHGEYGLLGLPGGGHKFPGGLTHLALLGYDARKYDVGLGPFEGAELGVVLGRQDVAFLCDLVTLRAREGRADAKKLGPHVIIDDETAGGIETEEARALIDTINEQLGSEAIQFYAGTRHRHLMVWVGGMARGTCCDPHDVVGQTVESYLPSGEGADILRELMEASRVVLRHHPVNQEREDAGLKPANCLWLWGPGKAVEFPKLTERYAVSGATVSRSDLHRGIGICAGLEAVTPEQDPESDDAAFEELAGMSLKLLQKKDFVYLHAQAPSGAGVMDMKKKVAAVEAFDQQVVGTLLRDLPAFGAYRLLVVCNSVGGKGQRSEALPTLFALHDHSRAEEATSQYGYNEIDVTRSPIGVRDATRVLARLFAST